MKLVGLIKMYLNKTYSKVRTGKHLSDSFPIQNGLKQGSSVKPMSHASNFVVNVAPRNVP
jgi:hypothetical protein